MIFMFYLSINHFININYCNLMNIYMSFFSLIRGVLLRRASITTRSYLVAWGVSFLFSWVEYNNTMVYFVQIECDIEEQFSHEGVHNVVHFLNLQIFFLHLIQFKLYKHTLRRRGYFYISIAMRTAKRRRNTSKLV